MSKWFLAVFFMICSGNFLFAQNLEIKGSTPKLYLEHVVAPKETLYSVSRLYNSSPRELAAYNGLTIVSELRAGQKLKIPLDENNFIQSGTKARNEALVPIYHTIASGETLYRLGVKYNKVDLSSLKKWNHLSSDEVTVGTPMVIGYLKVDKTQSAFAQNEVSPASDATATAREQTPPAATPEVVTERAPVTNAPEPPKTQTPVTVVTQNTAPAVTATPAGNTENSKFSGGYFKALYAQQTANKTPVNNSGSAGVFKSTSGWQDGKYYCFYNDVMPGAILKITNMGTGKSVYAKVLDAIPDIRQNTGLSVVLSNAAADGLGATGDKFECAIDYAK